TLATADSSGLIRLWNLGTEVEKLADAREPILDVGFAKDGRSLVGVGPKRIVHWTAGGKVERKIDLPAEARVASALPGGESALIETGDRTRVISLDRGEARADLDLGSWSCAAVDTAGERLAVASGGGIELRSLSTGKKLGVIGHRLLLREGALAFSPD